ncbi:hypothetical protein D8S78_19900 [Natrialba swarupiae]|nr:hypothetical protein [Natrialba swarupiae]
MEERLEELEGALADLRDGFVEVVDDEDVDSVEPSRVRAPSSTRRPRLRRRRSTRSAFRHNRLPYSCESEWHDGRINATKISRRRRANETRLLSRLHSSREDRLPARTDGKHSSRKRLAGSVRRFDSSQRLDRDRCIHLFRSGRSQSDHSRKIWTKTDRSASPPGP